MAIIAPIVSTFDNKGLRQAEGAFSRFGRSVGTQLKNLATAAAGIGVALGAGAVKAISAASDLDEAVSATRQIFGDASDAVLTFADSAAEAFGQSKQEALDGALVFGTFGKAAGLAGDDLSEFTTGLLGLSSDLASFRNATPEEAIEAIGAALRGESEPLRRFGVLLDDATLKAEALALGIYDGNGPLTQQQKILAAESAIYKQTTDAQGDFQRTSEGLANSSRILRARLANVTSQIGTALLPIALKLSGFFVERVIPAVEGLADTFAEEGLLGVLRDVWEWLRNNAPAVGEWALNLAGALVGWISENAGPAIEKLGSWLQAIGTWITDSAWPYLQREVPIWARALWEWIETDGAAAIAKLWEWAYALGAWIFTDALPYLKEQVKVLVPVLWDWVTDDVLPKLNTWLEGINGWLRDVGRPGIREGFGSLRSELYGWVTGVEADEETKSGVAGFVNGVANLINEAILTNVTLNVELVKTFGTVIVGAMLNGLKSIGIVSEEEIRKIPEALRYSVKLFDEYKELGKALGNAIVDGIKTAITAIPSVLSEILRAILPDWAEGFLGLDSTPPSVTSSTGTGGGSGFTRLAKGGLVTRPTFALVGEAGPEAVIPLSKAGAMGATYNITINGAVDPVSTARQIRQILDQDARRLGRLSVV